MTINDDCQARVAAVNIIGRCRRNGSWTIQSIDSEIRRFKLNSSDAALCTRITKGVMQNQFLLDYYIDCFTGKKKIQDNVRDILRVGMYQLLFCDRIPAHAAVSTSVEMCSAFGLTRVKGFVNAILRRTCREKDGLPEICAGSASEYLSIKYSHSESLIKKLVNDYGEKFTEGFLDANGAECNITIQVNTLKISMDEMLSMLDKAEIAYSKSIFNNNSVDILGGSIENIPGYKEGYFFVQDNAASFVSAVAGVMSGMKVLDSCSAPGGKSFSAAISMHNDGQIISCDIFPQKVKLIKDGAERLGISIIEPQMFNATEFENSFESAFDVVVADVPCSGIGVIRKKPEIRYKNYEDIVSLPLLQYEILDNVCRYVKPGGILIYSTCTVIKDENENIIEKFISDHQSFCLEPFKVSDKLTSNSGMVTLWPHVNNTDGFFIAKLKRLN